jgi:hypothetical protein
MILLYSTELVVYLAKNAVRIWREIFGWLSHFSSAIFLEAEKARVKFRKMMKFWHASITAARIGEGRNYWKRLRANRKASAGSS